MRKFLSLGRWQGGLEIERKGAAIDLGVSKPAPGASDSFADRLQSFADQFCAGSNPQFRLTTPNPCRRGRRTIEFTRT